MATSAFYGWDIGGAHVKRAGFDGAGRLVSVEIVPCALWRGLGELDAALETLGIQARSVVTMTGELVDLWPDRETGVETLARHLAGRLGDDTLFYAGQRGLVSAAAARQHWSSIASANWHASAAVLAHSLPAGLLMDVGSTTTDIVPFSDGWVSARGTSDADRLGAGELLYSGVARTPVMALAPALPFAGAVVPLMAELFATTADIHRLTGDLPADADLHPAADGGEKTLEGSARRLLRMVGRDFGPTGIADARRMAAFAAEVQMHRLHGALAQVISGTALDEAAPLVGAGVGRFLARRLAARAGRPYLDFGPLLTDDPALAMLASDCAPAVAVGRLALVSALDLPASALAPTVA